MKELTVVRYTIEPDSYQIFYLELDYSKNQLQGFLPLLIA
jgi:hypothetical protein